MWTSTQARGRWRAALASKSANDMHRSSRLQSTNTGRAPAAWTASGVAMNVLEGTSTASPRTPAYSSAASAPPVQPDSATASRPFQAAHAASNRSVIAPCDHCCESITSSHSACKRARSRSSKPIAKRWMSGAATGVKAAQANAFPAPGAPSEVRNQMCEKLPFPHQRARSSLQPWRIPLAGRRALRASDGSVPDECWPDSAAASP